MSTLGRARQAQRGQAGQQEVSYTTTRRFLSLFELTSLEELPRTRSAKIVRRAVRASVLGKDPGDLSSLENPEALDEIARAVVA